MTDKTIESVKSWLPLGMTVLSLIVFFVKIDGRVGALEAQANDYKQQETARNQAATEFLQKFYQMAQDIAVVRNDMVYLKKSVEELK